MVGVEINLGGQESCKEFGTKHIVNSKDIVAHVVVMTDGCTEYTFDCTISATGMHQALGACQRVKGRSIIVGAAEGYKEIGIQPLQLVIGDNRRGTAFGCAKWRTDMQNIVDLYIDGTIVIDPIITHLLSLDEINKGIELLYAGKSFRRFDFLRAQHCVD
jgi:S-(hydroxymethyl)glutathione dehydrogenase / alcohol dehydrogenase